MARLHIPSYDWWNEAVHGFARVSDPDDASKAAHVNATYSR